MLCRMSSSVGASVDDASTMVEVWLRRADDKADMVRAKTHKKF